MLHHTLLLLVLSTLTPSQFLDTSVCQVEAPQATPPQAVLPGARELVTKALIASGEAAATTKNQARSLYGTLDLPEKKAAGTVRILQARPDRFLEASDIPGVGAIRIGFDGKTAWMVHPEAGPQLLQGMARAQEVARNVFDYALHRAERFESMETVARETFAELDCYRVRCVLAPFEGIEPTESLPYRSVDELYAVESGLLVGMELLQATPLGDKRTTTVLSDYKELAPGLKVATRVTTRVDEREIVLHIDSISFEPIPEAAFAPPPEIVRLLPAKATDAGTGAGDGGQL